MDVLANVLAVTQLGNTVLGQSELLPPWGLEIDRYSVAAVHVVQRGVCWLRVTGDATAVRMSAGDLVLVSRGVVHTLADSAKTRAQPYDVALANMQQRLQAGEQSQDSTTLLCAAYEFTHEGPHPLLSVLPPVIHLRAADVQGNPQLRLLIELLMTEAAQSADGSELVVPRMVDSLLVFIVRAWLLKQPKGSAGWFGALRDPQIGRALSAIHERPEHPWHIDELAGHCAMSRPTFTRRFTELVGQSPGAYLTQWRMNVAVQLLRDTELTVDRISERVGYLTAAAFTKAFRRHFDNAPARYRAAVRDEVNA
jgi:AraC-like DNA-binding protein